MYVSTVLSFASHVIIFTFAYFGLPEVKKNIAKEQPIDIVFELPKKSVTTINRSSSNLKKDVKKPIKSAPKSKNKPKLKKIKKTVVKNQKIAKSKEEKIKISEKLDVKPQKKPKFQKLKTQLPQKMPVSKRQNEIKKKEMAKDIFKTLSKVKEKKEMAKGILKNIAKASKEYEKKRNVKNIKDQLVMAANMSKVKEKKKTLGISEIDFLRTHVQGCWVAPYNSINLKDTVDLLIRTEPSGSVLSVIIMDEKRYKEDVIFRATADSARRAVLECSPLPLPREKYELWKKFVFAFNMNND